MRLHSERCVAALALCILLAGGSGSSAGEWPQFRGDGTSVAPADTIPADWSIEPPGGVGLGRGVAWRADLPGRGVGGPIVVAGRVVVTASDGPEQERLYVAAYDAASGAPAWRRRLWATGRTVCHESSAVAAATPASDGQRVFALFSSNDLAAFDLDGNLLWFRPLALDHPGVGNDVGMASSPLVVGDAVVVQAECPTNSFAIALDRQTGATLWTLERPKRANWVSPIALEGSQGEATLSAVVLQNPAGLLAVDSRTGERVWGLDASCDGIPSATFAEGTLLVATSGLTAMRPPTVPGEAPQRLWQSSQLAPSSPSPVLWRDLVLVINRGGVLVAGDAATGKVAWRRRLEGRFWATPVVAGDRLLAIGSDGKAAVVDLAREGEVLGRADFGEEVYGTPAVSGDAVFVRSHHRLWKIADTAQAAAPRSPR